MSAAALKPVVADYRRGQALQHGDGVPVSPNYELRYWLAAGGLHPATMPKLGDTLGPAPGGRAAVGDAAAPDARHPGGGHHHRLQRGAWNQQAVARAWGARHHGSRIWRNNPEKVFRRHPAVGRTPPNTHVRLVKALLRAAWWLDADDNGNQREAARLLAKPEYVGADEQVIASSMTGTFGGTPGGQAPGAGFQRLLPPPRHLSLLLRRHLVSDPDAALVPDPEAKPDAWCRAGGQAVYRPDVYRQAARP